MITPWNLLIYVLDRDDLLENDVNAALNDMEAALGSSAPLTIVLQRDGSSLVNQGTTRYSLSPGKPRQTQTMAFHDAKSSLTTFLSQSNVAGAHTALVMWTHGTGLDNLNLLKIHIGPVFFPPSLYARRPPLGGFRPSYYKLGSKSSFISDPDVRSAIQSSGVSLDVLAFNACSMGTLEVLYEMADVSPIQVASPPLSENWPYGTLVDKLCQATTPLSGQTFAATIVASVQDAIDSGPRADAVFSFDSQRVKQLAAAIDPYGDTVAQIAQDPAARPLLVTQMSRAIGRVGAPEYIDIGALLANIDQPKANALEPGILPLLTPLASAKSLTCQGLTGASIFCPRYRFDIDAAYKGFKFAANHWKNALKAVQPYLPKLHH